MRNNMQAIKNWLNDNYEENCKLAKVGPFFCCMRDVYKILM